MIHLGRTMGFSRSRLTDADDPGRVIAVSSGMGVSLGDVPDGYEKVENPPVPIEDSPSLPPLQLAFGAEQGDDGSWRLPPLVGELSAPHAALHLGPICIVLEVQAMDAAATHAGTDALQIESWHVMMERPGVVGPFHARAEVSGVGPQRITVAATLHDEGQRRPRHLDCDGQRFVPCDDVSSQVVDAHSSRSTAARSRSSRPRRSTAPCSFTTTSTSARGVVVGADSASTRVGTERWVLGRAMMLTPWGDRDADRREVGVAADPTDRLVTDTFDVHLPHRRRSRPRC